jgi:hypothetical protein
MAEKHKKWQSVLSDIKLPIYGMAGLCFSTTNSVRYIYPPNPFTDFRRLSLKKLNTSIFILPARRYNAGGNGENNRETNYPACQ